MNILKYILFLACFVLLRSTAFSQEKKVENSDRTLSTIESKEPKNKKIQKQDGLEIQSMPTKSNIPVSIKKKKEKITSNTIKSYQTEDGDEVFYLSEGDSKSSKVKSNNTTNTPEILVIRDPKKLEQLKKGKGIKTKKQ